MKCPRCNGPVTIEPHFKVEGVKIFRCKGEGDKVCKDWGVLPEPAKQVAPAAKPKAAAKKKSKKK